jgi:hypothetical protein
MSVFGPNQVEELIVLKNANVADSVVKVADTSSVVDAAGQKFRVLQEEGDVLITQFTDLVNPTKVDKVILKEYAPAVEKQVLVGNFKDSTIIDNATYVLEVRILEEGGALSNENFAIVSGYYQTGTADTAQTVADGLAAVIQTNLSRRGGKELTVVSAEDSGNSGEYQITVTSIFQKAVAGKIVGTPIRFQVNHKIYGTADPIAANVNNVPITLAVSGFPGTGTGKYATNLEWFTKGYKYPHYRQTGYPADFGDRIPYFASADKGYNVVHIKYFSDRQSPTVEKQQKVMTILVERSNKASNSDMNTFLAMLRVTLPSGLVPANLATS